MLFLKVMMTLALCMALGAAVYALRLIKQTRYNVIWVLIIIGLLSLSALMIMLFMLVRGTILPRQIFAWLAVAASICVSIGMFYANKLIEHVDRLNRQHQLYNKRLLTAVLRTEEKSRSTFSKELHDGLGPLLSSAKMSLSALSRESGIIERGEIISNTTYVIDEAIRSLREISNNLSPHVLNDFGLARGIQNFINRSVAMHDVKIRFTTNLRDERFDSDIEVIIYRVVCELINNSLKHSACSRITISLNSDTKSLTLRYSDNGRGFNPAAVVDSGMGLANISSRINSLNGYVSITSAPNHGMLAMIIVRLDGAQPRLADEESDNEAARRDTKHKRTAKKG